MMASESMVSIPFSVFVAIMGEQNDGMEPAKLENALHSILPVYAPGGNRLEDLHLNMHYKVSVSTAINDAYKKFIESMPQNDAGFHLITVEQIGHFIHELIEGKTIIHQYPLLRSTFSNLPIIIVTASNLPKRLIYSSDPERCSQSVIVGIAFMDLTAKRCELQTYVVENSHMRWNSGNDWRETSSRSVSIDRGALMSLPKLAGIVTSAVESLAVSGSLQWHPAQDSDKIFCPIIVLHNSHVDSIPINGTETEHQEPPPVPDIPLIRDWLKSALLPSHSVTLLHSGHYIDEHPQVTVALSSALKSTAPQSSQDPVLYIDSAQFLHELQSLGDSLVQQLLQKGDQEDAVASLMALEAGISTHRPGVTAADLFGDIDSLGRDSEEPPSESPDISEEDRLAAKVEAAIRAQKNADSEHKEHEKALLAKLQLERDSQKLFSGQFKKKRRTVAMRIVPVFVLCGMDRHVDRVDNKGAATALPVMPLLDGTKHAAVVDDSVLILHTVERVQSRSISGHSGEREEAYDLNSAIASGLTTALTGLKAPHLQLHGHSKQSRSIIDLTWTHGNHPFPPFSYLHRLPHQPGLKEEAEHPPESNMFDEYEYHYEHPSKTTWEDELEREKKLYIEDAGVVSWAARRSIMFARIHRSVSDAKLTWRRGAKIVANIQSVLYMLQGTPASSATASISEALKVTETDSMHSYGVFHLTPGLADTMPKLCLRLFGNLDSEMNEIARLVEMLADSFRPQHTADSPDMLAVLNSVAEFNAKIASLDDSLRNIEAELFANLQLCKIKFSGDKSENRGPSSTGARAASRGDKKRWTGLVILPIFGGMILLGAVAIVLLRMQVALQKKAKKIE